MGIDNLCDYYDVQLKKDRLAQLEALPNFTFQRLDLSDPERVVQDLLSRPQYAERWGRHWMDIWRYSDWYGRRQVNDVRNSYPHIWRWRDWIIRSLNEDKGYDRMILEMLASDEIAPEDDRAMPALGFIARNWFRSTTISG